MMHKSLRAGLLAGAVAVTLCGRVAYAEETPAADDKPPAPPPELTFSLQLEGGVTSSFTSTSSNRVFGRLFDDQESQPVINQALLTAGKALDPAATGYDLGFKLQGMFGSDARYTRFTNEFQGMSADSLYQFDLVEANVLLHTPWLSEGGVDFKLGQYSTPIGAEVIDPSGNLFYSHSYIFNYGIPLKHTGVMATWHATPMVDLYASLDTGVNTGFKGIPGHAQNSGPPAFLGGIGLNLLGGDLTLLALAHIGTETPDAAIANGVLPATVKPDSAYREIYDLVTIWKVNENLTLTNEINGFHDDALKADGYGMAQYASWAVNDTLSVVGRGEIFVDDENALVSQFGANGDFLRIEEGYPATSAYTVTGGPAGQRTTYGELSLGLNYKPKLDPFSALVIRPELREDTVLDGGHPFHDGRDKSQTTVSIDFILGF